MRLLLDAYVSGPNLGRRLEQRGHNVRALDQKPAPEGLDDDEVLALATTTHVDRRARGRRGRAARLAV